MAVDVKFEGISFNGENWTINTGAWTATNHYYKSYTVSDGKTSKKYTHLDRGALPIIKKLATKAEVEIKDSWNAAKIAEVLLKEVLGDYWISPTRGMSQNVVNHAIIDGYLVAHVYENDGVGWSDSIKKNAHVYVSE